jgi:hypothetical protein
MGEVAIRRDRAREQDRHCTKCGSNVVCDKGAVMVSKALSLKRPGGSAVELGYGKKHYAQGSLYDCFSRGRVEVVMRVSPRERIVAFFKSSRAQFDFMSKTPDEKLQGVRRLARRAPPTLRIRNTSVPATPTSRRISFSAPSRSLLMALCFCSLITDQTLSSVLSNINM